MSDWLTDYQLFLYAKGTGPDDVFLRRCKKPLSSSSSSLVVPMKSDDFEHVSNVTNHGDLIRHEFVWDETDYKRLVKYIYERLLLVNRQGLVIAEIYKLDDANVMVPIYIRSLVVLPLKPYIPNIVERRIPLRTVKCLEDVNGKAAAMMEENDSNVITKLTARVDDLESKLIAGQVAMTDKVDSLESKLTADLVTQMNALTTLQQQVKNTIANIKEAWMNDITNSEWVGVEGLKVGAQFDLIIVGLLGTFTMDDSFTNVRARYWYKIKLSRDTGDYRAVCLEHLTPNKERARFSQDKWWTIKSADGKTFVCYWSGV